MTRQQATNIWQNIVQGIVVVTCSAVLNVAYKSYEELKSIRQDVALMNERQLNNQRDVDAIKDTVEKLKRASERKNIRQDHAIYQIAGTIGIKPDKIKLDDE